jgi:hypothetical protein
MKRYLVVHRETNGTYYVWSSYDSVDEISTAMYREFREAGLNEEYVVLDTQGTGQAIVRVYKVERRVLYRDVGALEKNWPEGKHDEAVKAYPVKIGDGGYLLRYI